PGRPCDFLTKEAVRVAAAGARGLPGTFLEHLHLALGRDKEEPDWQTRDTPWLLDAPVRVFTRWGGPAPAASAAIMSAVDSGRGPLDIGDGTDLFPPPFLGVYAIQSSFPETTLTIVPAVKDLLPRAR